MINMVMRLNEFSEDKDKFGKPTPSPEEIARLHNVPLEDIMLQLRLGIMVEQEHTKDKDMAREIALDHLAELPDYYSRLDKMENT